MTTIPEPYRQPLAVVGVLAVLVLILILTNGNAAKAPAPAPGQDMAVSATGTPAATSTGSVKAPAAPAKKPATKPAPTPTVPQTATNPAAIGRTPTFVTDQLKLSIVVSQYGAELTWTPSYSKMLKGYIAVKSTTDSNPYYPKEFWSLFRNADTGNNTWEDRSLEKNKLTYYRICVLQTDESVLCGNVATALKP